MNYDKEFAEKIFNHPKYEHSNNLFFDIAKKIDTFHHHPHLLYVLRDLLGPDHKTYMEIGSYYGASASLVMISKYPTTIISCDKFDVSTQQETIFMNNTFQHYDPKLHKMNKIVGKSQSKSVIQKVKETLGEKEIDLLFIDGDENYRSVVMDFINFHNLVSKGGFIVFDDYQDYQYCPQVKKAVDWVVKLFKPWYHIRGSIPNTVKASPGVAKDNKLLAEFSNEFILQKKDEEVNINFGIIMATYHRKNGSTFKKIQRAIKSIKNQTHNHWTLILIGDKYENQDEFDQIVKLIDDESKIIYKNLENAYERELHEAGKIDVRQLWNNAGSSAMQYGVDLAREHGFSHIAHLDDDDFWEPNHLEELNKIYLQFPEAIFVYTCGKFLNTIIPTNKNIKIDYNNLPPQGRNLLHSAVSWRPDFIDLKYPKIDFDDENNKKVLNIPADALMWERMREYMNKRLYSSVYVPEITVNHLEEGADYF